LACNRVQSIYTHCTVNFNLLVFDKVLKYCLLELIKRLNLHNLQINFIMTTVKICTCEQCKYQKKSHKNRNLKKRLNRMIRRIRKNGKEGTVFNVLYA